MIYYLCFFFFFSSRRRHTRCLSDWSSDVCSSDLDGPASKVYDNISGAITTPHQYVVERSVSLSQAFTAVIPPVTNHSVTIPDCCANSMFYRVRLVTP